MAGARSISTDKAGGSGGNSGGDSPERARRRLAFLRRSVDIPEVNVAIFAFLLNFPWEFLQAPLFRGLPTAPHWEAVKTCVFATMGDVAITLAAFWSVAGFVGSRRWLSKPTVWRLVGFIGVGLAVTLGIERWAITVGRWAYAETMPILPVAGVGLAPLFQWLILPALVVWFVRRQVTWAQT